MVYRLITHVTHDVGRRTEKFVNHMSVARSSHVLPISRMVYQPIKHKSAWSLAKTIILLSHIQGLMTGSKWFVYIYTHALAK